MTLKLTLNFGRLFEVADPNPKKKFTCQLIKALALHTDLLDLKSAPPIKSQNLIEKLIFFENFLKNREILGLKLTGEKIFYKMD